MTWPLAAGCGLLIVIALEIAYRIVFRWLEALSSRTSTRLDNVLVRRMRLPAHVLVVLVGTNVAFALRGVNNAVVLQAVTLVELLLVAYLVIEVIETTVLDFWLGEKRKVVVPGVVRGLVLIVLYAGAVGIIIGTVTGVNVAPLLATSTVITVVLGIAIQDTLGNLFSGLALSIEKPFVVGEWILIDALEGCVVSMSWRSVHLRTFSADIVSVPNAVIAKARLQNFSRPDRVHARNIDVIVPVNADPVAVEHQAQLALASVEAVRKEPAPRVWLVERTPLLQRWVLKVWLDDFATHDDVESDIRKAFVRRCLASGLEMPFSGAAAAVLDGSTPVA